MKTIFILFLFYLWSSNFIFSQYVENTAVYGQVQTDINRGYCIRQMADGNFLIAGQWNDQAYLMKVDCEGNALATRFFGSVIGGVSAFSDAQPLTDSSWVVSGVCEHCTEGDTTSKIFLLKVDNDLLFDSISGLTKLGKSARYSQLPASTQDNPRLLIDGNTLVLIAQYGVLGAFNASDFLLTKLNFQLDTLSTRLIHHQYFDNPVAIFKRSTGYLIVANHAFSSGAATIQIDASGNVNWANTGLSDVTATAATMLPNGNVLVCGVQTNTGNWIGEFSGTNGAATGNQLTLGGEQATDVELLSNGNILLAGWFPLFTGARSTRIYRLQTNPLQVAGTYDLVPNPDIFTNMGAHSIVPFDSTGVTYATAGVRGFYNRTFFHTKQDCSALTSPASFSDTLCAGESIQIGNVVFDQANPAGNVVLPGLGACGCDSTVQVTLTFLPFAASSLEFTFCPGASLLFEGVLFDENNPAGEVVFPGQAANGCDSVVNVALSFYPAAEGDYSPVLCPGASATVGGQTFDASNPAGKVVLSGQSVHGCDSVVNIALSFYPAAEGDYSPVLCPGASATVGGQTFDASNPAGKVVLSGQSVHGCDSVVNVALNFYPPAKAFISDTLFVGDSLVVGDSIFNLSNPSGTVVLPGASYTGCDSTIVVDLKFTTSIKESNAIAGKFLLFPNPVQTGAIFFIEHHLAVASDVQVSCLDHAGKFILGKYLTLPEGEGQFQMEAPDFAGVYWLVIKATNGSVNLIKLTVVN